MCGLFIHAATQNSITELCPFQNEAMEFTVILSNLELGLGRRTLLCVFPDLTEESAALYFLLVCFQFEVHHFADILPCTTCPALVYVSVLIQVTTK